MVPTGSHKHVSETDVPVRIRLKYIVARGLGPELVGQTLSDLLATLW